ncbi:hypothetical protein [Gordonia aurantiaca]|uniref:hypothetical protein n=1 Tax=Gordonia sp. B21 TaxID=3151852 RepID=UPI0032673069
MGERRRSRRAWSARTTKPFRASSRSTTTSLAFSALALASVVPIAVASTNVAAVVESLVDREVARDGTPYRYGSTTDPFSGLPRGTIKVATPDGGTMLIAGLPTRGDRQPPAAGYPVSLTAAGRPTPLAPLAPGRDEAVAAMKQDLAVMEAFADLGGGRPGTPSRPVVIVTDVRDHPNDLEPPNDPPENTATDDREWDDDFILPDKDRILVISDPRSPWGIKAWFDTMPWLKPFVEAAGIKANGARDPESSGKTKVVSVIIVGDPVSNFQWDPTRPLSSMLVNIAGYITIRSGNGPQNYDDLMRLGDPKLFTSHNTTYAVYEAAHPLALLLAVVYEKLGIRYDKGDLERWDELAQEFYPIRRPSVDTSAVPMDDGGSLPFDPAHPDEPKEPEDNPTPPPNQGIVPPNQGIVPPGVTSVDGGETGTGGPDTSADEAPVVEAPADEAPADDQTSKDETPSQDRDPRSPAGPGAVGEDGDEGGDAGDADGTDSSSERPTSDTSTPTRGDVDESTHSTSSENGSDSGESTD